jgi:RNA polymerase sigma-70 factor, ECF subfamily
MAPTAVGRAEIDLDDLEQHRPALTGYCYRMLGSTFEADDAVQETLVRAWRSKDGFEGRSAAKTWLFRIATNVCLDALRGRQRRARPMELRSPSPADPALLGDLLPEYLWVEPVPEATVSPLSSDPADVVAHRDTIRLAFVAALQHLPARQRAVLILREVLRWPATDVAGLLGTSVPAVNSALQRARATLDTVDLAEGQPALDAEHEILLARYVDAFERYDMDTLVTLLRDDAIQSMPPYAMWLQGSGEIVRWMLGPGIGCRGSRLVGTRANGGVAFGQYRPDGEGGHRPWALQVLEVSGGQISGFHAFLDTKLFAAFGLPDHL